MTVGTGFIVTLTALAPVLGARLSGLLSPFPIFGLTLAAFPHYHEGHQAAISVLRGLLYGLFSPAVLFFVLSGIWAAFAGASGRARRPGAHPSGLAGLRVSRRVGSGRTVAARLRIA